MADIEIEKVYSFDILLGDFKRMTGFVKDSEWNGLICFKREDEIVIVKEKGTGLGKLFLDIFEDKPSGEYQIIASNILEIQEYVKQENKNYIEQEVQNRLDEIIDKEVEKKIKGLSRSFSKKNRLEN